MAPLEPDETGEPPSKRRSAALRFFGEVVHALHETDLPRLAFGATRVLPDFSMAAARVQLLAILGCDIRRGTAVLGHVNIVGPRGAARNLHVGVGCVIGPDVTFCLDAPITLGRNVSIGPRAMLYTASHALGVGSRRMQFGIVARPIVVEDGAWIGLGAMVLDGVRIGPGAVVAAGAVVTRDVPAHALVAGNPAAVVQELPPR